MIQSDGSRFVLAFDSQDSHRGESCGGRGEQVAHSLVEAFEERIRFEMLLSDLSNKLLNASPDQFDAAIDEMLRGVVDVLGVDRATVAQFTGPDGTIEATHSFALPGIPAVEKGLNAATVPYVAGQLTRGLMMVFERLPDDMPVDQHLDRAYVQRTGIKSGILLPIVAQGSVTGAVVIDSFRAYRSWNQGIIRRARLIGEVLANALIRMKAEKCLRAAEQWGRGILSSLASPIAVVDSRGVIVSLNEAWRAFARPGQADDHARIGLDAGRSYLDVFERGPHAQCQDAVQILAGIRAILAGDATRFTLEYRYPGCDEDRWFLISVTPLGVPEGGAVVSHTEVTNLKRAQEDLRELSGRLITTQEEERSRIARELHDDINQRIALLTIELERLAKRTHDARAQAASIGAVAERARELSAEIQRLSHELHPARIEHLGLVAALRSLSGEYSSRTGIMVRYESANVPRNVPKNVSLCLYRVTQEALQNIGKHSGATEASVELIGERDRVRLTIEDSGIGLDLGSKAAKRGLGLTSMRERARLVGGVFSVSRGADRGTRIEVTVPCQIERKRASAQPVSGDARR